MIYRLYKTMENKDAVIKINDDGSTASFVFDENNLDYQAYLKWLDEVNTPEPADE